MSLGDFIKRAGEKANMGSPANRMYERQGGEAVGYARRAQEARGGAADFLGGISREQRQFYDQYVAPVQGQLSEDVLAGLNPDYDTIRSNARSDVSRSFEKARDSMRRRLSRYGQTMTPAEDQALQFQQDKAEVGVANQAADAARDGGILRANAYYAANADMPATAAAGYSAGATGLGDFYDYQGMQLSQNVQNKMQQRLNVANSFADGGIVRAAARETRPGATIELERKYKQYLIAEQDENRYPKSRDEWLADSGYTTDQSGLVQRQKYADGGMVDLESDDYIVRADVVKAIGPAFFDKLVEEAEAATGENARGGTVEEYADGGTVQEREYAPAYADGGIVGGFLTGLRRGFDDRRADDAHEVNMRRAQRDDTAWSEDRRHTLGQREREARMQGLQDEANKFSTELQTAAARTMATRGADWQAPLEVYNKKFPQQLAAERNADGTFNLYTVGQDGTRTENGKNIGAEEYAKGFFMLSNPKLFVESMLNGKNKKRYSASAEGVLDEWEGGLKPHAPGVGGGDSAREKHYNFLRGHGVPDNIASGIAGGSIKEVKDAEGMTTAFVNLGDNQTLGTLANVGGKPLWQPSPAYRPSGTPAMDNVQKSKLEEQALKRAEREAGKKASLFKSDEADFGMPRDQWIQQRAAQIVEELAGGASVPPAGSAESAAGAARSPAPKPTAALPPKSVYQNPKGKQVTWAQVQQMAQQRKMTTQDVINQLQLK